MADTEPSKSPRMLCLFKSGSRAVAVPLEFVREVVRVEGLTRLPLAPPRMIGLCTLRRDVIPIFTLASSDSEARVDLARGGAIVILKVEQGIWGLPVEGEEVVLVNDERGEPDEDDSTRPHLRRTAREAGVDYEVLDPPATWHEIRNAAVYTY